MSKKKGTGILERLNLRNTRVQEDNPEEEEKPTEEAKAQEETPEEEEQQKEGKAEGDTPKEKKTQEEEEEPTEDEDEDEDEDDDDEDSENGAKAQDGPAEEEEKGDTKKAAHNAIIKERKRIKALDDYAANVSVDKDLIYQAKYVKGWDVGTFMENHAKQAKKRANKEIRDLNADAEEIPKMATSSKSTTQELETYALEDAKKLNHQSGLR